MTDRARRDHSSKSRRRPPSDLFSVPILLHTIGLSGLFVLPLLFLLLAAASSFRLQGGGPPDPAMDDGFYQVAFSLQFVSAGLILVLGAVRLSRGTAETVDAIWAGVALLIGLLAACGWALLVS
jgi:hypothetical protein